MPHKLLNIVRLRKFGKIRKLSKLHRTIAYSLLSKMKILSILAKHSSKEKKLNFSRSTLFHMKTRLCLKYFVHDCSSYMYIDTSGNDASGEIFGTDQLFDYLSIFHLLIMIQCYCIFFS